MWHEILITGAPYDIFILAEKKSEFTKINFGCEFGFFSAKPKMSFGGEKVRYVGFQVHQKSSESARIMMAKYGWSWALPLKSAIGH